MNIRQVDRFGCLTFHVKVMKKILPKEVFAHVAAAMQGQQKLNPIHFDAIAHAMKEWAIEHGATHFCHWFQPMTGAAAEKHDAFLDWGKNGQIIEKFSGKLLFRGEPDASSFPSGGLRKTAAARGYTSWDIESPPFIMKMGERATLCIPSVFFSWCGKALDMKIPLMRSEDKLNQAACRLLRLLGMQVSKVFSTLGPEQEYFLIPRELFVLRPDLVLTGRTVFGAPSSKGQSLEDHYFSVLPEKVLLFLQEVEECALQVGIPLKTRHSEVAPCQYEVAPVFEKSSQAIDHNILLMQIMQQAAEQMDLACLFHEKPFAGLNGSGKHCNWSFQTEGGMNVLDPTLVETNPLVFLTCITAVLLAVHFHGDLLRASIASPGNDHRLGGNEAPPALLSVYLGEELERFLQAIEDQCECSYIAEVLKDVQIPSLSHLMLDTIDRNRTSPFAFTGNKFEFRSVGASAHPAGAVTVLNAIVAHSLHQMCDEIEKRLAANLPMQQAVLEVVRNGLKDSKNIRYLGDNYQKEWRDEAQQRGYANIEKSLHACVLLAEENVEAIFHGILSREERLSRVEVFQHHYAEMLGIESKLMIELFYTQILPSCLEYQTALAQNVHWVEQALGGLTASSKQHLFSLSETIQKVLELGEGLKQEVFHALALPFSAKALAFCDRVQPQMILLRKEVDELEMMVQDPLWPLPKYRELLFSL